MLYELINSLNKAEVRHLKIFLNRTATKGSRKDIELFDYARKHYPKHEDNVVFRALYGPEQKNAFYRLKNRLQDDINKSVTLQYYHSSEFNQTLFLITLSRHYQSKGEEKITYHYLKKAEKKALEMLSYDLLDIIYSDYIRFSQETLSINPEQYITKRKENRTKLNRIREIDDILAVLVYRIKLSQNFSQQNYQIIELLQKTIDDFSQEVNIKETPQLRFRIYHAVSRILLQQHDYKSLEEYLLLTLKEFTDENLFNKNNHDTKLQLLTYLSNALFKNKKHKTSLKFAEKLKKAMAEYNNLLHDKYLFYYYNALVNNYSEVDEDKAISILQEAIVNNKINLVIPHSRIIFNLNLSLQYFDKKEFKLANKCIVKLKLDDRYTSLDDAFKLKIAIAELIIRFEQNDHDYVEKQIGVLKKQYVSLLKDVAYFRQREVLDILSKLIYCQNLASDKNLLKQIDGLTRSMETEEAGDSDILNYNSWLKAKIRH